MMDCTELKCARIRRRKSTTEMANAIGKSDSAWNQRERGETAIPLEEVAPICNELSLTEDEVISIFFDGILPFRK